MDEQRGPEHIVKHVMMPAVRETYEDLLAAAGDADLLVAADLVYVAPLVAAVSGLPWVAVTMAPFSFLSRHDPPVLSQAPWLARLADVSKPAYAALLRLGKWRIRHWGERLDALRDTLGLPREADPLFAARERAAVLLGMFSPVFGPPQPDWPRNARATGFAFYDRHEPMPDDLHRFLDNGEAPIVFTLGSAAVFDPGDFYRESAAAARLLGRRGVLLVGPEAHDVPTADDQIAVAAYAPYSVLLPRAAAVVHQGGIGTTAQALRAGRPMLIVPFSHDQPDNAARVVRLGAGLTVRRRRYSAQTAAAALRKLIEEPSYARRSAAIAEQLRHEDGASAAASAIERAVSAG